MKAMILAAGRGSRLGSLTDNCPKPLIKIHAKPLLAYHLEALHKFGIRDVVINISYLGDMIQQFAGDGQHFGLTINYSHEPEALDVAGGIMNALPLLGADPFLVISPDAITDFPLAKLSLPVDQKAMLAVIPKPYWHHGDFALSAQGQLLPEATERSYTYTGLGIYRPDFFHPVVHGKAPFKPYLLAAAHTSQLSGVVHHGFWQDVGTPERLAAVEAMDTLQDLC